MRRAVRILGTALALSSIGALVVWQLPNLPPLAWGSPMLWAAVALSLSCYVLSQAAAAEAWRSILALWGVKLAPNLARSQPMVSQIGKYIPGNVAHLFGRVVIGRRDSVPVGTLAASMTLEIAITLAVGLGVAVSLLMLLPDALPDVVANYPGLGSRLLALTGAAVLVLGIGAGAVVLRSRLRALSVARPPVSSMLRPLGLHLFSFAILGVSLWGAAWAVVPDAPPDIVTCTLVFAFAWAAGFVVPGAPGGIGVRDSIIVLGLAVSLGEGTGLAIALLHRGVSVMGDVATFGLGWTLRHAKVAKNGPEPAPISTL